MAGQADRCPTRWMLPLRQPLVMVRANLAWIQEQERKRGSRDGQGGDGYLRIMTFQPNGAINVSSYSPYLKQYHTDPENLFTLSL